MKKKLFFFLSLVAMVFTMAAFTSCSDDDDNETKIVLTCKAVVDYDIRNTDDATAAKIKEYEAALNQRLVKMFGKEFKLKYDESIHKIDEAAFNANNDRIYNDKEFYSILEELDKLKTTDGVHGTVSHVYVHYYSGDTYMGSLII